MGHRVKLEKSKKRDKYLDLARGLKKTLEHESDGDTNYNWCTWNNSKRIDKETRRLGNKMSSGDHPDYSIIKIGKNTEKSPEGLRSLTILQSSVKNSS